MTDTFWANDPSVLFTQNNFTQIIPRSSMTRNQKLNALTRFFIYLLIILLLLGGSNYITIPIFGIVTILIFYYFNEDSSAKTPETFDSIETNPTNSTNSTNPSNASNAGDRVNKSCELPTKANPMMNVTMADWMNNTTRPPACDPNNYFINQQMQAYLNQGVFKDPDDLFDRGQNQRAFYTMPSTTIPDDRDKFLKFAYQIPPTCKEDSRFCLRYEDLRYNQYNPTIDKFKNDNIV